METLISLHRDTRPTSKRWRHKSFSATRSCWASLYYDMQSVSAGQILILFEEWVRG